MAFFDIIFSPFVSFVDLVFNQAYNVTSNYGLAILLLSFVVSLLLLPVFIYIEKAKRKDDALKLKMKPLVDEIKRCYKGQERYYYLKTLNRQYNYSPLRALIPILSLLLQIPFFIAAYQFLKGFEPLSGVSFLFIKDLAEPDGMLGSINILPILMTAVNLITAYFYTRNGDGSERKQMLIVAGVFLVLLFNLPSGLVLYWTMNNVFSFFRLFVTNPEVFNFKTSLPKASKEKSKFNIISTYRSGKKMLKTVFFFVFVIGVISQVNWAYHNSFNGFAVRILAVLVGSVFVSFLVLQGFQLYKKYKEWLFGIEVKPPIFFGLIFSVCYFYFSGLFYFGSYQVDLLRIAAFLLIPSQLVGLTYVRKDLLMLPKWFASVILIFLVLTASIQLVNIVALIHGKDIVIGLLNMQLSIGSWGLPSFVLAGILFLLATLSVCLKSCKLILPILSKTYFWVFALSILYLTGLIFIWNPIIVYSSYPDFFDFQLIEIVNSNLNIALIVLLALIIGYVVLTKKLKALMVYVSLVLVLVFFVNVFIVPLDLGTLQVSKFSSEENLSAPFYYYVLEFGFLLLVFSGGYWLIHKRRIQLIIFTLIVLNVALVGQGLTKALSVESSSIDALATKGDGSINFSKTEQNVVLILYDGFQGWFMDKIVKEDPKLKESLEGFIWYPNTISISSLTYSSSAAIMCGYDYSVDKINADSTKTLGEKVDIPCNAFINRVKDEGYSLTSTKMWHSTIDKSQFDNFIPSWHEVWDKKLKHGEQWEIWYNRLWENALFYSVPLAFKPKVYNDQNWLVQYDENGTTSESHKYNFLRLLPMISKSNSKEPNFIYIHNMAPHSPWNQLGEDFNMEYKVSPYENNKWCLYRIADWVQWMKDNDVYDNTKIVLLSDHGPTWEEYKGGFNHDSPLKIDAENPDKILLDRFWRLNSLLMVKDFSANGEMKEDWRLMSNADASYIIFDEENPMVGEPKDRVLPTSSAYWEKNILVQHQYKMYKYFNVTGNAYDLKNWKEVEMDYEGR